MTYLYYSMAIIDGLFSMMYLWVGTSSQNQTQAPVIDPEKEAERVRLATFVMVALLMANCSVLLSVKP